MRRIIVSTVLAAAAVGSLALGTAAAADPFPNQISLPAGWRPEGLAVGRGTNFYVGSLVDGAIFHGDLRTGQGSRIVDGTPGTAAVGLEIDQLDRIWVAGGGGGTGTVYDAAGTRLAQYQFTAPGATFVNDAVVTGDAVYFTDSARPFLYVVPLGPGGTLPDPSAVRALPLSGGAANTAGFNNGIEATADGRSLLVVQSRAGKLFQVDPGTGASREVDLGGASVINGDGLIRRGDTLYVVQNRSNQVAVVQLEDEDGTVSGRVIRTITNPALDVPSTAALFGPFVYVVNARFTTPPTPTTPYAVVQLPA